MVCLHVCALALTHFLVWTRWTKYYVDHSFRNKSSKRQTPTDCQRRVWYQRCLEDRRPPVPGCRPDQPSQAGLPPPPCPPGSLTLRPGTSVPQEIPAIFVHLLWDSWCLGVGVWDVNVCFVVLLSLWLVEVNSNAHRERQRERERTFELYYPRI